MPATIPTSAPIKSAGARTAATEAANPLAEFCISSGREFKAMAEEPGAISGFETNRAVTIDGKQYNYRWLPSGPNNVEVFYLPKELMSIVCKATCEKGRQFGIDALTSVNLPGGVSAADFVDGVLQQGTTDYHAFKFQRQNDQPVVFVPFPPANRQERLAWASFVVHEITHARGFDEPLAYREQFAFLARNGMDVNSIEMCRNIAADGAVLAELKHLGNHDFRLFWGLNEVAAERCRLDKTEGLSAESATTLYRAITDNLFREPETLLPMALALLTHRSQSGALDEVIAHEERPAVRAALVSMDDFSRTQAWISLAKKMDAAADLVVARKS